MTRESLMEIILAQCAEIAELREKVTRRDSYLSDLISERNKLREENAKLNDALMEDSNG
jgi:chorismate mutase